MASWDIAYKRVLKSEGGYVPPNAQGESETYRGIDRTASSEGKNWKGWLIIDAVKQTRTLKRGDVISSAPLEQLVKDWYRDVYFKSKIVVSKIVSQSVADMVYDFIAHKNFDAIGVINAVGKQVGGNTPFTNVMYYAKAATTAERTKVSESTYNVMNNNAESFYTSLFEARKGYYNNPAGYGSKTYTNGFSTGNKKNFLERVDTFPKPKDFVPPTVADKAIGWFF